MAAATVDTLQPAHGGGAGGISQRPSMTSVGTIIWLSSELMFFSALFAIYFTIRASSAVWPPHDEHPHVGYSAIFTTILVLSSLTCQLGVFAAEKGDVYALRRWYALTFLMGLTFVLGQANEYRNLVHEHLTFSHDAYMSCFFLTTGFHFLHVCGGLFAFIIVLARSTIGKFTPARATSAIVTSYYWHFVDVVWIGLFVAIYLIQ